MGPATTLARHQTSLPARVVARVGGVARSLATSLLNMALALEGEVPVGRLGEVMGEEEEERKVVVEEVARARWPPARPLPSLHFPAMVSHVDWDGRVHLHPLNRCSSPTCST